MSMCNNFFICTFEEYGPTPDSVVYRVNIFSHESGTEVSIKFESREVAKSFEKDISEVFDNYGL